jgi:DNA-binding transcriptional regulator YiaG
MASTLSIGRSENGSDRSRVYDRQLREKEFELTIVEVAAALGKSASTIENWEIIVARYDASYDRERAKIDLSSIMRRSEARQLLRKFMRSNNRQTAKNVLFGKKPLKFARTVLNISAAKMAEEYGYQESTWKKMEANIRPLDRAVIYSIENRVKRELAQLCGLKD